MAVLIIFTIIPLDELLHDPETEMPDRERERLWMELFHQVDAGAMDPKNEILEP
jgi:hypothetical protein